MSPLIGGIIIYQGKTWGKYVAGFRANNVFKCEGKKEEKRCTLVYFPFYAEIESIGVKLFCLKMQSKNIAFSISRAVINIRPYNGETEIAIFLFKKKKIYVQRNIKRKTNAAI